LQLQHAPCKYCTTFAALISICCKCCATLFARLRVVAVIIFKFYRKFYCSCDQSLISVHIKMFALLFDVQYAVEPWWQHRECNLEHHATLQQLWTFFENIFKVAKISWFSQEIEAEEFKDDWRQIWTRSRKCGKILEELATCPIPNAPRVAATVLLLTMVSRIYSRHIDMSKESKNTWL